MALQKFNVHYEQKHNNSIYTSEIIALGLYDLAPFQGGHSNYSATRFLLWRGNRRGVQPLDVGCNLLQQA